MQAADGACSQQRWIWLCQAAAHRVAVPFVNVHVLLKTQFGGPASLQLFNMILPKCG